MRPFTGSVYILLNLTLDGLSKWEVSDHARCSLADGETAKQAAIDPRSDHHEFTESSAKSAPQKVLMSQCLSTSDPKYCLSRGKLDARALSISVNSGINRIPWILLQRNSIHDFKFITAHTEEATSRLRDREFNCPRHCEFIVFAERFIAQITPSLAPILRRLDRWAPGTLCPAPS